MTPLLESLERLKQDRGAMAALRKALIPEQCQRCFKYLPRIGCKFESESEVLRFSIIAHFWGHHPKNSNAAGNLGQSMRTITRGEREHPFNKRFERLIAADSLGELAGQLRGVLSLLKGASASIDFDRLTNDLFWFSRNSDRVKREWCGGFYVERQEVVS
jgi:CRISPR type I-E-associated protein CasB/Cse2